MAPPKRFAPPPTRWPGAPPSPAGPGAVQTRMPTGVAQNRAPTGVAQTRAPVGATQTRAPTGAIQPQATFGALRTSQPARGARGDELLPAPGENFLLKTAARGLHVKPDGTYNFVRVNGGKPNDAHTLVSPRSNHAGLADGRPVLYAGTVRFEGGKLDWWSNYSGTYQPAAAFRQQAGLPDDRFVPWQRLQMGGVGLQRTMLGERRSSAKPETAQPPAAKPAAAAPAATTDKATTDRPAAETPRRESAKPAASAAAASPPGPGAGSRETKEKA